MIHPAAPGALCARHPAVEARWTCPRCGAFMCATCERRVRPEALPMCVACWALRERSVEPPAATKRDRTPLVGLVLGAVALVPGCFALQLAALALNVVALVRTRRAGPEARRWQAWTGLGLTLVGLAGSVALLATGFLADDAR